MFIMSEETQASPAGRARITLDLSNRLNGLVEKIAAEKETTKADVLRVAIEYLAMANEASHDGMKVGAWKDEKDKNRRLERVFGGI
jgi:hypothetical protein